jgi:hypothetical protein
MPIERARLPAARPLLALGGDPGRSGSLALVFVPLGAKPQLVGLWPVTGAELGLYWQRASAAAKAARVAAMAAAEGLGVETDPVAYIESIPVTMRQGSIAGVDRGLAAWAGLGQRRGLLLGGLYAAGWEVAPIEQGAWARAARVSASKQVVSPQVRVAEAGALVEGAAAALAALPQATTAARDRVVDAAESILIALGAALIERSAGAQVAAVLRGKEG